MFDSELIVDAAWRLSFESTAESDALLELLSKVILLTTVPDKVFELGARDETKMLPFQLFCPTAAAPII